MATAGFLLGLLALAEAKVAALLWVAGCLRRRLEGAAAAAAQPDDQELPGEQPLTYKKKATNNYTFLSLVEKEKQLQRLLRVSRSTGQHLYLILEYLPNPAALMPSLTPPIAGEASAPKPTRQCPTKWGSKCISVLRCPWRSCSSARGARRNSDAVAWWMCGVGSGSSPVGGRSGATPAPTEYCLGNNLPE